MKGNLVWDKEHKRGWVYSELVVKSKLFLDNGQKSGGGVKS